MLRCWRESPVQDIINISYVEHVLEWYHLHVNVLTCIHYKSCTPSEHNEDRVKHVYNIYVVLVEVLSLVYYEVHEMRTYSTEPTSSQLYSYGMLSL